MALNTLPAGAFADDAISSDKINLANNFAFTGTVTGAGAGAYEVINSSTSTSTSIFEVTGFDNGNNHFLIAAYLQPLTANGSNHLMCQFGNDSGYSSVGHSVVTEMYARSDGGDLNYYNNSGANDGSKLQMTQNSFAGSTANPAECYGIFYIYAANPNQASVHKHLGGHGMYNHTGSYSMRPAYSGTYGSNTQFKKAKIFLNSGENLKGTVTLYGSLDS
jgi:hypothetical protein